MSACAYNMRKHVKHPSDSQIAYIERSRELSRRVSLLPLKIIEAARKDENVYNSLKESTLKDFLDATNRILSNIKAS
jgi:hypothetical protein